MKHFILISMLVSFGSAQAADGKQSEHNDCPEVLNPKRPFYWPPIRYSASSHIQQLSGPHDIVDIDAKQVAALAQHQQAGTPVDNSKIKVLTAKFCSEETSGKKEEKAACAVCKKRFCTADFE